MSSPSGGTVDIAVGRVAPSAGALPQSQHTGWQLTANTETDSMLAFLARMLPVISTVEEEV